MFEKELDLKTDEMCPPSINYGDTFCYLDKAFLTCGDCTDKTALEKLMLLSKQSQIHNVITSPPYAEQRKKQYGGIKETDYVNWFYKVQDCFKSYLTPQSNFLLNIKPHSNDDGQRSLYVMDLVIEMVRNWGWKLIDEFCWIKNAVPKNVIRHFKNGFEPVYQFARSSDFYFYPKDVRVPSNDVPVPGGVGVGDTSWDKWQGTGKGMFGTKKVESGLAYPSNVIIAKTRDKATGHPAVYSTTMVEFFIKAFSQEHMVWLDPFAGSGTTGISALRHNRKVLMIEINPVYCQIIINRFRSIGINLEKI